MVDVLAFGAHPDDVEFGAGAVLTKMAAKGKSVVIVDLTTGQKGSNGTAEERKKEAFRAAELIGAKRIFLDFVDCEVFDQYEARLELVKVIREYKPKLVLAPLCEETPNHPDHIACGKMARIACRYSRFRNILPHMPIHRPDGILHYLYPSFDRVDFIVDISSVIDQWTEMMLCHQSQMKTNDYVSHCKKVASYLGMQIGVEYGQGFVKRNAIEVDDLMAVSRGTVEI